MASFSPPLTEGEVRAAFPGRFLKLTTVDAGGQGAVFRGEAAAGGVVALKVYVPDPGAKVEFRSGRAPQYQQTSDLDSKEQSA